MRRRAPAGYRVRISDKTIRAISSDGVSYKEPIALNVDLIFQSEVIGYVEVLKTIKGFWETHSYVDTEHRGRGLGTMLYGKAIDRILKRGHEIRSSSTPSNDAVRVWESQGLNNVYVIRRNKKGYKVLGRKSQHHC